MPSSPDPRRAQRLDDVYARAERLRRQRRARLGSGALLGSLAVFVVGLLVGSNLGLPQQLTTIGRPDPPPSTTTTERPAPTSTDLPVDPAPDADAVTPPDGEAGVPPATNPLPPPPVTTTPTTVGTAPEPPVPDVLPCRNSRDPACGPLRYEPPPVNQPMTVEVAFSPRNPEPGEEVTFTVRVNDDGPATPMSCMNSQTYGEPNEAVGLCTASCVAPEPRHGPWDPPPPEDTSFQETFRHAYAEPGTFTATFAYNVGEDCTFSPYRSQGEASVTVTVTVR